jgi:hypothetical protein
MVRSQTRSTFAPSPQASQATVAPPRIIAFLRQHTLLDNTSTKLLCWRTSITYWFGSTITKSLIDSNTKYKYYRLSDRWICCFVALLSKSRVSI